MMRTSRAMLFLIVMAGAVCMSLLFQSRRMPGELSPLPHEWASHPTKAGKEPAGEPKRVVDVSPPENELVEAEEVRRDTELLEEAVQEVLQEGGGDDDEVSRKDVLQVLEEEERQKLKEMQKEMPPEQAENEAPTSAYLTTRPAPPYCTGPKQTPLLVLGTTMMTNDGESRNRIQRNSLLAFKALEPDVKVVVFTSQDSEWETEARKIGLETSSNWQLNRFGAPFFRTMMAALEESFESPLYGYVNGDILFAEDLILTLKEVVKRLCEGSIGPKLLVIGKRRNTEEIVDLVGVSQPLKHVKELRNKSQTFLKEALDYFFMSKKLFNWRDPNNFPDFVIGRNHYDNAIALMALRTGTTIIDASPSITAIHQNEEHGNFSGDRRDRQSLDRNWNLKVTNPMKLTFEELREGHVGIAHHQSHLKKDGVILTKNDTPEPSSIYPIEDSDRT